MSQEAHERTQRDALKGTARGTGEYAAQGGPGGRAQVFGHDVHAENEEAHSPDDLESEQKHLSNLHLALPAECIAPLRTIP